MRSMTGFGHYVLSDHLFEIEVEIKSVNHRFFDLSVSCSSSISQYEHKVRELISEQIARGKIYCSVNVTNKQNDALELDLGLLTRLHDLYKAAYEKFELNELVDIKQLMRYDGVIVLKQSKITSDLFSQKLELAIQECLEQHIQMTEKEGNQTKQVLVNSLSLIQEETIKIEQYVPIYREELRNRYTKTIEEVINQPLDDGLEKRILAEVSFYIDRYDITEEIVRLKDHIEKMRQILEEDARESGKKMNFIILEMNREIQTMGSKFNKVAVSHSILTIKEEIERCRELIQNVE